MHSRVVCCKRCSLNSLPSTMRQCLKCLAATRDTFILDNRSVEWLCILNIVANLGLWPHYTAIPICGVNISSTSLSAAWSHTMSIQRKDLTAFLTPFQSAKPHRSVTLRNHVWSSSCCPAARLIGMITTLSSTAKRIQRPHTCTLTSELTGCRTMHSMCSRIRVFGFPAEFVRPSRAAKTDAPRTSSRG